MLARQQLESFSVHTSHYNDLDESTLKQLYKLRKHVFIDRLKWNIVSYNGGNSEKDEYDNSDSYYIYTMSDGILSGCVRLRSSSKATLFTGALSYVRPSYLEPSISAVTWEASRFCLKKYSASNSSPHRNRFGIDLRTISIFKSMVEFGINNEISQYEAAIVPAMSRVLRQSGWEHRMLNKDVAAFGEPILYVLLPCTEAIHSKLSYEMY
ncbi:MULTISPECIES: acyl-homoserine-lactone synthase [Halomonas]|uniref:acyl-homoserine-lactone synthase n=1 Tax=unclassified Halomonas TaxID=2609666 RepID=UPI00054E7F43|nr:Acyl-homoserine lactone synthase [Halomonas sp. R57-5]